MSSTDRRSFSPSVAAGVLLIVAVVVGIVLGQRNFNQRIDEAVNAAGTPEPSATTLLTSTPSATVTEEPLAPVVLWVGDSYLVSPEPVTDATCPTEDLGWDCLAQVQRGTGFVTAGTVARNAALPDRLDPLDPEVADQPVDVIVVDAGRNDREVPWEQVRTAAAQTFASLHAAYPDATLVAMVPFYLGSQVAPLPEYADFATAEMERLGGVVVDPIAEGWARMDGPDAGTDPTLPAARAWISDHVVADLRGIA